MEAKRQRWSRRLTAWACIAAALLAGSAVLYFVRAEHPERPCGFRLGWVESIQQRERLAGYRAQIERAQRLLDESSPYIFTIEPAEAPDE